MMSNALPNFMNIPYAFPSLSQTSSTTNNFNPTSYTTYHINPDPRNNSICIPLAKHLLSRQDEHICLLLISI